MKFFKFFVSKNTAMVNPPPGSFGLPFIGETPAFVTANSSNKGLYEFVKTRHLKYGSCFKTSIFGGTHVFISSTEAAKLILSGDSLDFPKRYISSIAELLGDQSLLCASKENHKIVRHRISNLLDLDSFSSSINFFDELTLKTMAQWEKRKSALHHLTVKILKIPEDLHFVLRMRHMFESLGYQTDTNGVLFGRNCCMIEDDLIFELKMDHGRWGGINAYGLVEVKVLGDGNCQFRAISDQLYRSPEYHKHVRKEIVKQLKKFRSLYEGYVPMRYKHYYKKMSKIGEWGDHVTLQAAADKFGAKICLLTSFRDTCFVEIVPRQQPPQRELYYYKLMTYTVRSSTLKLSMKLVAVM
ncbi:hypothetical protein J5N97_019384 [Dioscorea zingiberensis]|uniref:OTU domain-containing protein n=1 Tax=Dioscorea zingiberensis TaxID=325984 RepID=A0A9D5CFV5_9LILI|nr:hypothetical protein J5N97_019384 [Dioscorea zingiberensis]